MAGYEKSTRHSARWILLGLLGLSLLWAAPVPTAAGHQPSGAPHPHVAARTLLAADLELTAGSSPSGAHAAELRSVDAAPAGGAATGRLEVATAFASDVRELSRASAHVGGSRAPPVEGLT